MLHKDLNEAEHLFETDYQQSEGDEETNNSKHDDEQNNEHLLNLITHLKKRECIELEDLLNNVDFDNTDLCDSDSETESDSEDENEEQQADDIDNHL